MPLITPAVCGHPVNILYEILESIPFPPEQAQREMRRFKEGFFGAMWIDPKSVTNKDIWERMAREFDTTYRSLNKNRKERQSVGETVRSYFGIVQELYARQFAALEEDNYDILFHEGTDPHPLGLYADDLGIRVTYLDEHNPHYETEGILVPTQIFRELHWIDKIQDELFAHALLLAGERHIDNEYGLRDELKKRDMYFTDELLTLEAITAKKDAGPLTSIDLH